MPNQDITQNPNPWHPSTSFKGAMLGLLVSLLLSLVLVPLLIPTFSSLLISLGIAFSPGLGVFIGILLIGIAIGFFAGIVIDKIASAPQQEAFQSFSNPYSLESLSYEGLDSSQAELSYRLICLDLIKLCNPDYAKGDLNVAINNASLNELSELAKKTLQAALQDEAKFNTIVENINAKENSADYFALIKKIVQYGKIALPTWTEALLNKEPEKVKNIFATVSNEAGSAADKRLEEVKELLYYLHSVIGHANSSREPQEQIACIEPMFLNAGLETYAGSLIQQIRLCPIEVIFTAYNALVLKNDPKGSEYQLLPKKATADFLLEYIYTALSLDEYAALKRLVEADERLKGKVDLDKPFKKDDDAEPQKIPPNEAQGNNLARIGADNKRLIS